MTPYVFSATPKVYLEVLINHFELEINPNHVFGSSFDADANGVMLSGKGVAMYGEGIVIKIEAILQGHTPVFVSGVAEGDFKMVDYVLDRGGSALIRQDAPSDSQSEYPKRLAVVIKERYGQHKRVHIQHVHSQDVKWLV